ncbi:unnamed protein product [Brassica rapa subsp. trilocularis]
MCLSLDISPPPPMDFPSFDVMLLRNKILIYHTRIILFQFEIFAAYWN